MRLPLTASLLLATTSLAVALPNPDPRARAGANHHEGDDSFAARFGRAPTAADDERVRMRVHLEHVRAKLAARPATRPALAARRAELLGYLDDYIAKGTTPTNAALPWRTPVFIDERGAICAVGYLIERTAGRALPERIAREHRHEYLEDIAAAMPEVAAWIEGSGFTLEELASIQPAYSEPAVDTWRTWDLVRHAPPDGPYARRGVAGTFRGKRLVGTWTVTNGDDVVVGRGELRRGSGAWTSFYPDGKRKLAEGPYVDNVAHGRWTFFHPSGHVAAEGAFARGHRTGPWRFYQDTPARTLIARGRFDARGHVVGRWRHYDAQGALLATTRIETPTLWGDHDLGTSGGEGHVLDIVPGADGVRHQVHQGEVQLQDGSVETYAHRLELLSRGADKLYVHRSGFAEAEVIYDAAGFRLEPTDEGWTAARCRWSAKRREIAAQGDVARLHGQLFKDARRRAVFVRPGESYRQLREGGDPGPACGTPVPVSASRARTIEALLAPRRAVRAPTPAFVRALVLGEATLADVQPDDLADADADPDDPDEPVSKDLTRLLAAHMTMYLEWPHIDGRFVQVFATMAGRRTHPWASPEPEADEDEYTYP